MTSQPNVLVVFTDQQRWDTVGAHGNRDGLTPNFDRLARQGMFLRNSFTCQPVCGPARSVFQSGQYPTSTGCFRNGIPLPDNVDTLARAFGGAGYDTGYIGKWHLAGEEPVPAHQRGGYHYWLGSNLLEFTSHAYDTVMYDGDCQPVHLPGYRVDAVADAVIRYMATPRQAPFFLFMSLLEPHHQNDADNYPAPLGSDELLQDRLTLPPDLAALGGSAPEHFTGYMGMVARIDAAFGRMIDALESLGQLDNTIILFTSDHGCHFKTRNDEYKRSCHEASIHVPTVFYGPKFTGAGPHEGFVSLIDLPPTLLDAAGIAVPASMQGQSILSTPEAEWPGDMFIQISESQVGRALRTKRWKYGVVAPDGDGWNQMNSDIYRETYLYDLEADHYELNNLVAAPAQAETRVSLRQRLVERMVAAGEAAPQILPA